MKKAQVVLSTKQNTVNLIPLLMPEFEGCDPVVLSSAYARKNHWTANLEFVLGNKGAAPKIVDIPEQEDENNGLAGFIVDQLKDYGQVYFNISGGKKNQILPLLRAYQLRNCECDRLLYADSNPFRLQVYKGLEYEKDYGPRYLLSLEDILNLYGYTCRHKKDAPVCKPMDPEATEVPREKIARINELFLNDDQFAHLMYSFFDRMEYDRDEKESDETRLAALLAKHKPKIAYCRKRMDEGTITRFENVATAVKGLKTTLKDGKRSVTQEDLTGLWNKLSVIPNVDDVFNIYWGAMRNSIIDMLHDSLKLNDPVILDDPKEVKRVVELCAEFNTYDMSGNTELRHSDTCKLLGDNKVRKGTLFENMLAMYLWQVIHDKASDKLDRLFMNIKAYSLDYDQGGRAFLADKQENENLVEFDLAFVTDHGTLLVFECKTFGLTGDQVKSKSWSAAAHGGVFSTIVLSTHVQRKHLPEGGKPSAFIPLKLAKQLESVRKYTQDLWFFDQIGQKMENVLNGR